MQRRRLMVGLFLAVARCTEAPVAPADSGVVDAGPMKQDSGSVEPDASIEVDAGATDSGFDAGDAGPTDSGFDAGPVDSGFDAGPVPTEWVGVIGNGQSLSVGANFGGNFSVSHSQPFRGKKLLDKSDPPLYRRDGVGDWAAVPLTEPMRRFNCPCPSAEYPYNIGGETPHTGMAATLSALSLADGGPEQVTAHSCVGTSGAYLTMINKRGPMGTTTGQPYPAGLMETRVFRNIAADAGLGYRVGAVIFTHGEADWASTTYAQGLYELWQDYNADLKAITGQTQDIPLILTQHNTFPPGVNLGIAESAEAQWRAAVTYPGKIVCAGPKYQYSYGDVVHLTAAGYRRLGEKYAQVFDWVVNQKKVWKPLYPVKTELSGAKITVTFHVPVPPLTWADHLPLPHQVYNAQWKDGRGFEALDSTGFLTISSVAIVGNTVEVLLSAPPSTGLQVRYAAWTDGLPDGMGGHSFNGACFGGSESSHMGQLVDSDPFRGYFSAAFEVSSFRGSRRLNLTSPVGTDIFSTRELIEAPQLPKFTVITDKPSTGTHLDISKPWDGGAAPVYATVRHDHRNYAVQFILPVPYTEP